MTVPVGADGVVDVYASAGGNVIVDLLGYYTAADYCDVGSIPGTLRPDTGARHAPGRDVRAGGDPSVHDSRAPPAPTPWPSNLTSVTNVPGYWQVYPQGGAGSGDVEPELAPRLLRRRRQPGDRDGRPLRHGQHLLRTGWRPAHRPRRDVHGRGRASVTVRSVRADDRTDAHRGHAGARAQSARRARTDPLRVRPSRCPSPGTPRSDGPTSRAVVLNATSAGTLTTGFVTVSTAGAVAPGQLPPTSTMNVTRPAQVLANHAIVPVSARGFSMFTQAGGDMLADLAGYFIGSPCPRTVRRTGQRTATRVLDPPGRLRRRPGRADRLGIVAGCRGDAAGPASPTRVLERRHGRRLRPHDRPGRDGVPEVAGPARQPRLSTRQPPRR